MRVALLADVHGNAIALDVVLADIQDSGGADAIWVLGDLVAIGHDPIGVLERLSQLPSATIIRGNTDRYLVTGERPPPTEAMCEGDPQRWRARVEVASSFAWTQGMITASEWMSWLEALPVTCRLMLPDGTNMLGVHASPGRDDGDGIYPGINKTDLNRLLAGCAADLVFVGHTHWPMEISMDNAHVVNVGSVSNPFPPDLRASYVMLTADASGYQVVHRRVAYDTEAVIAALDQVKHPAADYIAGHMHGQHFPPWQH